MPNIREEYDVVVVGAGHAGCEAALASARMGFETIIFTVSVESIAMMPCNPNIGGSSKGHLVREIDALGGEMGKNIDATFIQSKMLNASKGLAVHSLRAQTGCAKCVLDLDTVMPGLSAYDFGDGVRFGASSAAEDEKDLDQVWLKLDMYQAFLEGYLDACGHALTPKEIEVLPLGAKIITAELAMRFLKDYLDGDVYFKIDYPTQNLDRCLNLYLSLPNLPHHKSHSQYRDYNQNHSEYHCHHRMNPCLLLLFPILLILSYAAASC